VLLPQWLAHAPFTFVIVASVQFMHHARTCLRVMHDFNFTWAACEKSVVFIVPMGRRNALVKRWNPGRNGGGAYDDIHLVCLPIIVVAFHIYRILTPVKIAYGCWKHIWTWICAHSSNYDRLQSSDMVVKWASFFLLQETKTSCYFSVIFACTACTTFYKNIFST
jgi:hypothetical protein